MHQPVTRSRSHPRIISTDHSAYDPTPVLPQRRPTRERGRPDSGTSIVARLLLAKKHQTILTDQKYQMFARLWASELSAFSIISKSKNGVSDKKDRLDCCQACSCSPTTCSTREEVKRRRGTLADLTHDGEFVLDAIPFKTFLTTGDV
jgi:hypothetical protein